MYKCKECGAEYEEKPDYCDCGNDEFIELSPVKEEQTLTHEDKKPIDFNKTETEKPPVQPASSVKFSNIQKEPVSLPSVDPLSLGIFCVCIFLSFYVVFFAWNVQTVDKTDLNQVIESVDAGKNIPSIDKFWNSTPPEVKAEPVKQEEVKPIETVTNVVKQIIPVVKPSETKKTSAPVTKSQPKKTTAQTKTTVQTKTPARTTTTEVSKQPQESAEDLAKKKAEQERLAAEAAQIKKLQAEQAKKAAEEKAKKAELAKQEYLNYKVQLRNAIGRKIDFTRVIGDGACTVAFKIDSTGKLINRSFAKQSTNNTLNDAVYNAVMATPSFNPPPEAYNNEVLNLNIRFSNGNFEISLP